MHTCRSCLPYIAALLAATALPVLAQPPPGEVEKQLLLRQQYQDELQLRQRQFAERANPSLTPGQRLEIDRRQFDERTRQRALHDDQLRRHLGLQQVLPQLPESVQQQELARERAQFERERASENQRPPPLPAPAPGKPAR